MAVPAIDDLILRALEPCDRVAGLSLGHADYAPLKAFLRRNAKGYHQNNISKTYVVVDQANPPQVWAYISLTCSQVTLEQQPDDLVNYPYSDYPAIKIVRLAVDTRISGSGIGQALVDFAISVAKNEVMPKVGCRFIVVDSKRKALDFYQRKCGFTLLDTAQNRVADHPLLFIDLHKL